MSSRIKLLSALWLVLTVLLLYFNISCKYELRKCSPKEIFVTDDLQQESGRSWTKNMRLSTDIKDNYSKNNLHIATDMCLVYRYSKHECSSCVREDLEELYNIQLILGKEKILVLPAYDNTRNDKIVLTNELQHFTYKNISLDSLLIPLDSEGIAKRYFALISKEGNIEMVFFPQKGKKELTQLYFAEVKKRINIIPL